jgi:hypothetical protein
MADLLSIDFADFGILSKQPALFSSEIKFIQALALGEVFAGLSGTARAVADSFSGSGPNRAATKGANAGCMTFSTKNLSRLCAIALI